MEREQELEKVLDLIKERYDDASAGMYFTRNVVGDGMTQLFEGEFFTLEICYDWGYYELFGCDEAERNKVEVIYETLRKVAEEMGE